MGGQTLTKAKSRLKFSPVSLKSLCPYHLGKVTDKRSEAQSFRMDVLKAVSIGNLSRKFSLQLLSLTVDPATHNAEVKMVCRELHLLIYVWSPGAN